MITFTDHDSKKTLGTADLDGGKLVASTKGVQSIIDGKMLVLDMDAKKAYDYFSDWSNGYLVSKKTG